MYIENSVSSLMFIVVVSHCPTLDIKDDNCTCCVFQIRRIPCKCMAFTHLQVPKFTGTLYSSSSNEVVDLVLKHCWRWTWGTGGDLGQHFLDFLSPDCTKRNRLYRFSRTRINTVMALLKSTTAEDSIRMAISLVDEAIRNRHLL